MTDQLKGYWQNGENQDVEVLNYGRKWNYLHMFENHVRHAHMKKQHEDDILYSRWVGIKNQELYKSNYNCGGVHG